jgi:two-component system, NtrC family, sensor kinase
MVDYYRVPTFILLGMSLVVFAALYVRSRVFRRLFWLLGWTLAVIRLALQVTPAGRVGIGRAVSEACMMLAALMFLGSMSLRENGGRVRILYLVSFGIPLTLFTVLISLYPSPGRILHFVNCFLVALGFVVVLHWCTRKGILPIWLTLLWAITLGVPCLYLVWTGQYREVLWVTRCGMDFMTALLVLVEYRRWTPGVFFTVTGLVMWSLPALLEQAIITHSVLWVAVVRGLNIMKVLTAMGMIVLVVEDEALQNEAVQMRDRRAREEMEQYSRLDLSIATYRNFGVQYDSICEAVTRASRFRQALILVLELSHDLRMVASSGVNPLLMEMFHAAGRRLSLEQIDAFRKMHSTVSLRSRRGAIVDFGRLLDPAGELEAEGFAYACVVPMMTRSGDLQAVLVLGGLKNPEEPLLVEDLLPLELLASRVAAARENGHLLRRVVQSEKLAGIGQLAGGVAHELNNPLTVVMGYAELMQDSAVEEKIRRNAEVILHESQRMRQIIEGLARFWKPSPAELLPLDLGRLLTEITAERRLEYERTGIALDIAIASELPEAHANPEQMRQVFLQILSSAEAAVKIVGEEAEKRIRLEALLVKDRIQVLVSNTGPGFQNPDRAFDPFFVIKQGGSGPSPGLGLSLCYSIVREHGGDISAVNLQPEGSAVVIEIPVEHKISGQEDVLR